MLHIFRAVIFLNIYFKADIGSIYSKKKEKSQNCSYNQFS
jgi:hypothetical protein